MANTSEKLLTEEELLKELRGTGEKSPSAGKMTYYSRPSLGADTEKYQKEVKSTQSVLKEKEKALKGKQSAYVEGEEGLELWGEHVRSLQNLCKTSPTKQNKELLIKAKKQMEQMLLSQMQAEADYASAYHEYEPAYRKHSEAVNTYNSYVRSQERLLNQWKSSIRDPEVVKLDLDGIDKRIADLKKAKLPGQTETALSYLGGTGAPVTNIPGMGYAAASGLNTGNEAIPEIDEQLRQLQQARDLLREEYDWGRYATLADLGGAADFGTLTADERLMVLDLMELESWSPEDRVMLDLYNANRAGGFGNIIEGLSGVVTGSKASQVSAAKNAMKAQQTFDLLAQKYGEEKVRNLAETRARYQNMDVTELVQKYAAKAVDGKVGASIGHSLMTVPANVVGAVTGPIGILSDITGRTGRYETLDPNNLGNVLNQYSGAVRGQVAENISGDQYDANGNKVSDGGMWRQIAATAYEGGMSAADSLARIFVSGGSGAISLGLAATGSFSQTVSQASSQGANPVEAVAMGIIDGGLEVLTEKVSLDNLFKESAAGPKGFKAVLKGIFKSGAIEVSEEELSFIGSTLAEAAILQEKSSYNQRVQQLVAEGKTLEQAKEIANWELVKEAVHTAATSFLSGEMMGAGAQAVSAYRTSQTGKDFGKLNLDKADIQDLIDSGLESADDTESYQIATEIQKQIDEGKTPSNYDLARLWQANQQAIADEEAERAEGAKILEPEEAARQAAAPVNAGETKNAPAVTAEGAGVTQNGQSVIGQAQNVTQEQQNVPRAPLSIAEQIRQNKLNQGGTINGTGQFAGAATDTGAGLLSGSGQWLDGTGTGEPVGGLAGRAGQAAQRQELTQRNAAAVSRINRLGSLRLPTVSTKELGLPSGTESRSIRVVSQEHWDSQMQQLAQRLYQETGKTVTYVAGRIQVKGADGRVRNVNGAVYGDNIVIRADHLTLSMEQIADHEAYHGRVEWNDAWRPGWLNQEIRRHIVETFSQEEFDAVVTKYVKAMAGIYDMEEGLSEAEYQQMVAKIEEEVLADAYAGINAFGFGADRFTSAVNEKMEQIGLSRYQAEEQANGVRETAGPPDGVRYSYAGEDAETADSQTFGEKYSVDDGADIAEDNRSHMIYPGMDDSQRAEILMQKEIRVPAYDDSNPVNGAQIIKLKGKYASEANEILRTLARKCGVISNQFYNSDADLEFKYSMRSVRESINKQAVRGGSAEEFGKMLTLLPQICENAVEIEAHSDKYIDTRRMDPNLKEVHVLVSAFSDEESTVPVQLEIKEYRPETRMDHKLYITVTMKNEAGISSRVNAASRASIGTHNTPASVISLSELVENVKDNTGDLIKYFPDSMLSEEQKQIKAMALERDEVRLKDMRYEFAVENQNTEKAREMLRERAAEKGYSKGNEHRMAHRAPDSHSGVSLVEADRVYGGDGSIYTPAAAMYYGEGRNYDGKAIRTFTQAYYHPDSSITVYRAVPNSIQDTILRNGDWVSPTREYAQEHGERMFDDGFRIISQKVPVRHLYVNGDSIHEFGYDNGRSNEVYKNVPNNVKLDEVTYDDAGWLIPLSKRYDESISDIRYSVDDGAELTEDDFARVQAALKGQSRNWSENYLRNELGDEGYEQYRAWEKKQAEQQKLENREKAKARNAEKQATRKAVKDPVAESKPIRAKRELRQTVLDLFSIPEGSRAELGAMIESYADRLLKNGALTEEDRKHFFDRMYDSGVMTVPAEDYFSQGRDILKGGRVYVPESVRIDFGDDWNEIRRRAFGARIYFTSDPNAGGIDAWNHELAEELPGLFDSEETDLRSVLERIVEIAEEGQDNKMSLSEFTAMMAGRGEISADEFLDHMERQMDCALRTFAENARLEISLRDWTGRQIAKERAVHKETAQRQQARKELRQLQEKTLKTLRWLNKNRNRAPEELKAAWDEVLGDIDLYAIGAADEMRWSDRYNATWKDLAQMYKDAQKHDPNFLPSKELEMIVGRLDGTKIEEMDLGALNDLYKAAVGLRTEFYNRNNVVNDEMNRLFAEVYRDAKGEIEAAPGSFSGKAMDKLLNLEQLTPMNVLQRMGGWDPNGAFYSMAKQLEKGERDMRAYSVKAQKMLQEFLTENADWVKKADGQGKDGIWYEVEIPELVALELGKKPQFGATIKVSMTPAQKVHLYLESKNVDNLRHMTGGRTFADKKLYSEGKRQEALAQGKTVRLAPETVKALVSDLTEQEMELARLLEQYYNSFATQEINRVSNILYGYDKAMGKNYAPIYTNKNYTKTEFGVFDQTAEGVGNLKGRQYAENPSYNISAFDAFERHVDQTARFVGMAIPARNWTTLMNWREKNNSTGDVITHKWGEEGKKYITDLINTLQAGDSVKADAVSSAVSKLQSTYITSIFGANPSIVLKQLGSIPLASAYLDAKNVPTPAQIKSIDRKLIGKYTQDLTWRTMGYATPETRQLKENPNWTQTNKFYKFTFGGGAITAMDGWAASVLWPWAENKVRRDFPELEVGTHEQIEKGVSPFYKKVAELFEDALARSQSTTDEIHQSSLRKSKNPVTKAFTMFRSDSAQTYNTLRQKIGEARYYARTNAKPMVQEAAKKAVGAAVISLLLNAMWAEAVNFLVALWKNKGKYYRDDEGELTFGSVAGEMVSGVLGSIAGIVTGGEEVMEVIGNLLTGEKIYDIETPGIEQLNDLITAVTAAGGSFRDVIAGAVNVAANGGNVADYFGNHSRELLGNIKDLAEIVVMYIPGLPMSGLPVSNIEAYLLGAVKWLSPELGTAYDDLFQNVGKSDLSKLEGDALESRVGRILRSRNISESDDTAKILAELYGKGHRTVIPSDVPSSVSIKGEKHTLQPFEQQAYDSIWGSIVSDALDDIMTSDSFSNASDEEKTKLLNKLYDYASEMAKAELFDGYEMDGGAEAIREISKAGLDIAECVEWAAESASLKQADKFQLLRQWDMPESAKKAVIGTLIGTELKTESGKDSQYAKMLEALKQGATVDEYLDMRLAGTDVDDFLELVEGGMDDDIAIDLLEDMAKLDSDEAPDVAKWRICVDFSDDVEDQLTALFGIMTTEQYQKVEMANSFGVTPDAYVTLQELNPKYDADGNGSFKNAEIKAAVDAMPGNLSKEQKAVLWQLATGSTSAKNNPYSKTAGQKILDAKAEAKAKSGT